MRKKALIVTVISVLAVIACAVTLFACKPTEYTVTFELGGGEMQVQSLMVEKGEAVDLSAYTPTRQGYVFTGWTDESGNAVTLTVVNSDVTFTAGWQAAQNTVTYYVNGEEYLVTSALTGETVTLASYDSEKTGEFFGWFTDGEMTSLAGTAVVVAPAGTVLYGAFIDGGYFSVTFDYSILSGEVRINGLKDASVESVFIPSAYGNHSVRVDAEAFRNIASLKTVYLGETVAIDGGAFAGSGVDEVVCMGENYRVSNGALYYEHELVFVLADTGGDYEVFEGTTAIRAYAFAGNKKLTGVTLPASLTTVGRRIFADCNDTLKVVLRANVNSGFFTEWNCKGYTGEETYSYTFAVDGKENGYTYTVSNGKAYIFEYEGSGGDIVVPRTLGGYSVCGIGGRAFAGTDITSVTVHSGIEYAANEAFASCQSLVSVEFEGEATTLGAGIFAGCSALKNVILPSALASIPSDAFTGCSSLDNIILPDTLEIIEAYAFYETAIKEITIPASVISIEEGALGGTVPPETPVVISVYDDKGFDWYNIVGGNFELRYI